MEQYFLYYLWLKFGRLAANPFGDDDDDIDIIELLQAHIDVLLLYLIYFVLGKFEEFCNNKNFWYQDSTRVQHLYCGCEITDQLVTTSLQCPVSLVMTITISGSKIPRSKIINLFYFIFRIQQYSAQSSRKQIQFWPSGERWTILFYKNNAVFN